MARTAYDENLTETLRFRISATHLAHLEAMRLADETLPELCRRILIGHATPADEFIVYTHGERVFILQRDPEDGIYRNYLDMLSVQEGIDLALRITATILNRTES